MHSMYFIFYCRSALLFVLGLFILLHRRLYFPFFLRATAQLRRLARFLYNFVAENEDKAVAASFIDPPEQIHVCSLYPHGGPNQNTIGNLHRRVCCAPLRFLTGKHIYHASHTNHQRLVVFEDIYRHPTCLRSLKVGDVLVRNL